MHARVENLEELDRFASRFIAALCEESQKRTTARVVGLHGDLGSGKTTFTKSVAKALGITDTVTSPTFVIEKRYTLPKPIAGFRELVHIDAYRLESGAELAALGFRELLDDPANLIFIEWPERVADVFPDHAATLSFAFIDDHTRTIE
jgi:tRNA threonylcarbamoyladenosine biosynthesis protein TsaE